jgi:two-component system, OmpR family, phosphate regulon sensor histidine kinase PhoR
MVTSGGGARGRTLFLLIAAVTIVPLCALSWVAVRSLEQDRILDRQQARERLEAAGDLIAAAIQRAISNTEQRSISGATHDWPEGIVVVRIAKQEIDVSPRGRIAFLPVAPVMRQVPDDVFREGESFEFQRGNRAAAIREYRRLSRSPHTAVRAGAQLRLGRNLAAIGQFVEASAIYAQLESIDDIAEAGVPLGLAAAWARCALLDETGQTNALTAAARNLNRDLETGRWAVTAATHLIYLADAARWAGTRSARAPSVLMAAAVERVWADHADAGAIGTTGWRAYSLVVENEPFTVLSQRSGEAVTALIANPTFVESEWLRAATQTAGDQFAAFRVNALNVGISNPDGVELAKARGTIARMKAQTELPWDLEVWSTRPSGSPALRGRRQLVIGGIAMVALLSLAAGFAITRSVKRELAVARLQSEFVAAVSHEFRTPLTALRQFTDMLRDHPELDASRQRICYDAQARATDRLTHLVESLLDFGRMEAGARRYQFTTNDCAQVVEAVVTDFRLHVPPCHPVRCHAAETAGVSLDTEAFSRALWNLLDNAVKYSPEGGSIDVGVHRQNGHVLITVRDHGLGIPDHERMTIFEKFRRGDAARTRGIKGTGLGLAMVDQIVRAHRGRVDVTAPPGGGSTFTIVLPVAE